MAIDSRLIAKNTIFLYTRLILVLLVTFYTSRVVLDLLGEVDYALYFVIYGVIGMVSFLNGTLSIGTSRFITFELGKGEKSRIRTTFSTAFVTHLILAGIVLILGETVGLWYVTNVMVVSPGRTDAAFVVYQISILTTMASIILVPFTSEIMAHEKMNVYAYIGIYEAVAKLIIVFLLVSTSIDKLVLYASLIAGVTFSVLIIYVWYCIKKFEEVSFSILFDKEVFKSILKFSGWNIVANLSNTLSSQGVIMLFNLLFQPIVVASQAIANQISNALIQFVNNVRSSVNPQVIKLFAERNFDESKKLTLISAEYVFYLLLLVGVPCIIVMPTLLDLWLVEVPAYAVVFARFVVLENILGNFSAAFYTPMIAANKIKKNSMASVILSTLQFVILYILFRYGFGPLWARYLSLVTVSLFSFIVKPYILWKDVEYTLKEIYTCIWKSLKVLFAVMAFCVALYILIPQITIWHSLFVATLSVFIVVVCSFLFMDSIIRKKIFKTILIKIIKR